MGNDIGDEVRKTLEEAGYRVADAPFLFDNIDKLYGKPSVEDVIEEELPRILEADPQFFLRNQLNLTGVTERLTDLYASDPQMKARYKDPVDRVSRSFKLFLKSVFFFMVDHPNSEELEHTIDELKKILDGRFLEDNDKTGEEHIVRTEVIKINSIRIPNIYAVREDDYPLFASYGQVHHEVRGILPFVNDYEARKVTMTIMSAGEDFGTRALRAKEVFEKYLNEARSLVVNTKKPIPDFYDRDSNVCQVIERARDAILVE